jgi:hypothetical protein
MLGKDLPENSTKSPVSKRFGVGAFLRPSRLALSKPLVERIAVSLSIRQRDAKF